MAGYGHRPGSGPFWHNIITLGVILFCLREGKRGVGGDGGGGNMITRLLKNIHEATMDDNRAHFNCLTILSYKPSVSQNSVRFGGKCLLHEWSGKISGVFHINTLTSKISVWNRIIQFNYWDFFNMI